jgi:hypothetical protein
LAENKRAHPQNWLFRNESMITQRTPERRSLLIHRSLQESREKVVSEIMNSLVATEQKQKFPNLSQAPRDSIHWFTDFIFQVLSFSIKTRDRYILSEATQIMTSYCYNQGYKQYELKHFMYIYQKTLKNNLLTQPNLAQHADRIHDFIDLNLQFIIDEIEDNYEALAEHKSSEIAAVTSPPQTDFKEIFRFAQRIESICGDPVIEPPQIQTPAPGKDSQGQIHGD